LRFGIKGHIIQIISVEKTQKKGIIMKRSRNFLALCAAAKLLTTPLSASAQEVPEQTMQAPVVTQVDYSILVGFVKEKSRIVDMYRLFLERRPAFTYLDDGKMGWYSGQSGIVNVRVGSESGWSIGIKGLSFSDAVLLYPLMTGFLSAPDIQRDFGANGSVWMYCGEKEVLFPSGKDYKFTDEPKSDDKKPATSSLFGVQVGAFKIQANAAKRLAVALAQIDSRFQIIYADGFYKVRLLDVTVGEAVAVVDRARFLLGTKEADFVVNGVTTSYNEGKIRDMATRSR
jgi:hypothetical protein